VFGVLETISSLRKYEKRAASLAAQCGKSVERRYACMLTIVARMGGSGAGRCIRYLSCIHSADLFILDSTINRSLSPYTLRYKCKVFITSVKEDM